MTSPIVAALLFLTFLVLAVYPYLIYPPLVRALARALGRPWLAGEMRSGVSVIISAFNEEDVIRRKVENALALRYPEELLEVVVVSDGCTDRTNEIVASIDDRRLALRAFPEQSGKTACLNRVVPEARGDIVLFTDANSLFPADLLEKVVPHFADTDVGLVSGWTQYGEGLGEGENVGVYARLERSTKAAESLISSCVGADGAVFAVRKVLFRPMHEADINDFVIPLQVVGQGKRAVLDPEVFCFEEPADGAGSEFRRQVRITTRTLRAITRNVRYLNPFAFGWFSFFLLSHKVLRFLVPIFLAGAFLTSLWLARESWPFAILTSLQALLLGFSLASLRERHGGPIGRLCALFLLTLCGQLVGWARWAIGRSDVIWSPQR